MPKALRQQSTEDDARLASSLSGLDSDLVFNSTEIYTHLIAALRNLLNCAGAAILIPRGTTVHVPVQFGPHTLPSEIHLSPSAAQVLAHMSQTRQPLALNRPTAFQPPLPAPAADIAWFGLPLILESQLHACISIVGDFRPGDERLAYALVQQAITSLLWGMRYAETQRQIQQTRRLLDLQQHLYEARDQAAMLEIILDAAIEATHATHSCVFMIQNGRPVSLARRGYNQDETALLQQIPPSLQRGLHGRAYQTGALVRSDDVLHDPEALPALVDTRAQVVIPICVSGHVLGLIDLQSTQPNAFRAADDPWLQSLGAVAAIGLERLGARHTTQRPGGAETMPQHELLLSSRLAAVTDLAAGVAHEINNPLTTILGYTHLLLRDQSLPQTTRDDIGQIMIEGQRIASLVARFLRFAQPSSSGKQPLAINEPLLEALELLKGRLQEIDAQVTLELPAEPPMVLGQRGQLEQVFLDLLQNAIEAMSTTDKHRISVQVSQQGEWTRIAIGDTGRGIAPDLLTRIFEPGFTTKVDKGISRGLGLGLYAAHTIVQDHWGRIEVQSQIWQGSTFTVCLPAI
jgi:signal transduction histidine kinase